MRNCLAEPNQNPASKQDQKSSFNPDRNQICIPSECNNLGVNWIALPMWKGGKWLYIEAKITHTEASVKYNTVCLCVINSMWLYIEAKITHTEASVKYNTVCLCILYATSTCTQLASQNSNHSGYHHRSTVETATRPRETTDRIHCARKSHN